MIPLTGHTSYPMLSVSSDAGHDAPASGPIWQGKRRVEQATDTAGSKIRCLAQPTPPSVAAGLPPQPDNEDGIRDWLGQPLPINHDVSGRSPLDGLVPLPRQRLTGEQLEEDRWLRRIGKEPDSFEAFRALTAERRTAQARDEDFCFAPLTTTLRNMKTFVGHMRAGKQFHDPLTDKEDQAMAWVAARAQQLLTAGAPYKKTVHLAMALLVLCEIVTDRQVLNPLERCRPEIGQQGHLRTLGDWSPRLALIERVPELLDDPLSAARLDPLKVTQLCWGGINPDGPDEVSALFGTRAHGWELHEFFSRLDNPDLLVYPSFQALDIDDFCRFGHLPLHPVGMITDHAQVADGILHSPLEFAFHDLEHMRNLASVGDPALSDRSEARYLLARCDKRLLFRCLLLDQLPARLAPLQLEPALTLLLFQLFHENMPVEAVDSGLDAGQKAFLWCLRHLARARRGDRHAYTEPWLSVTDTQAAMAACWTLRLWTLWQRQGHGQLSSGRLDACAQQFVAHDVPRLEQHLAFVRQHRPSLRQFFSDPGYAAFVLRNDGHFEFRLRSSRTFAGCGGSILFGSFHAFSGLHHLDYTDVVWFAAQLSPGVCRKLARRFPDAPDPDFFPPASLVQEQAAMEA